MANFVKLPLPDPRVASRTKSIWLIVADRQRSENNSHSACLFSFRTTQIAIQSKIPVLTTGLLFGGRQRVGAASIGDEEGPQRGVRFAPPKFGQAGNRV